ncbi:pentatricopeptide repeat-containing protein At3g20730 isoform X2 [Jatropha curcas]|uniref:pentatricopeptide repeat-containing protein At3g20730 isoform X2 n=1 Tax=Jatropha curcas TaxID=180498 RepID=UPI0009D66E24|nr:pentatricopeptide repeat-containing protein At3g20730 isoform X2 [Jatropha curcas]
MHIPTLFKQQFCSLANPARLLEVGNICLTPSTHLDSSLFMKILQLCIETKASKHGCLVHSHIIRNGLHSSLHLSTKLIIFYSKLGDTNNARRVFDRMSARNVVTWTAQISGYTQNGYYQDALLFFREMGRAGARANQFTYGSVLRACTGLRCVERGMQIQGCIQKSRFLGNVFVQSALIDLHSKCGNMEDACYLFGMMSERDVVSWNAMIGGYAVQGFSDDSFRMFHSMMREALMTGYARDSNYSREALELLREIQQIHMEIDDVTLCTMLNICADAASLDMGRQIHALALKYKPNYDVAMGNALVDMYAKSGEIEDATRAFYDIKEKNVISWTSLITGYGKHGYGHEALALYKKMECEGLKPNDITFLSLLFACSHSGMTREGWECFNNMINKYDILPRTEHFSCIVDLFARGGQLEAAYNMICKMDIKPNASLWGAILGACSIYGNISLGEVAATHLFNIDPENPANYVVLSSLYAAAGAWDNACKMRNLMEERSLTKIPGYSFVQSTKKNMALLQPI